MNVGRPLLLCEGVIHRCRCIAWEMVISGPGEVRHSAEHIVRAEGLSERIRVMTGRFATLFEVVGARAKSWILMHIRVNN